ncbi:MAG: hypothetical protein IT260_22550, partial [Saprospiraceae bacterium]|nr:hypothetical protein [Saprospiraceae bacterium]
MKKAHLLLFALGLTLQLPAQVNVDSLRLTWNNPALADTNRLKALLDISWDLLYANPDSGRSLAWQGLEFARSK